MPISISEALRARAEAEGFSSLKITPAKLPLETGGRLRAFIERDRHGDMGWLATTAERRISPDALWPEARSAVMFAANYNQGIDALARLQQRDTGVISLYALGRDYHDVIKGKLKRIAAWFAHETGADVKIFVDTAALMEKPLAAQAGLGWQGKHTNLVSRELGSWFFIGAMLTDAALVFDEPETDHCGSCRACLDICPTNAFPAPYQLDARRCISYLTIEHKGHIAREFRKPIGNRIFGCDDCLAVCPWNKFAQAGHEAKLQHREDLLAPALGHLARLDDAAFRKMFAGSPVKRLGRNRFIRNVMIAMGNSGKPANADAAYSLLTDLSPLVRAMAVWALAQLLPHEDFSAARDKQASAEPDAAVREEWLAA
jgi:epoxyqueuosine reductase